MSSPFFFASKPACLCSAEFRLSPLSIGYLTQSRSSMTQPKSLFGTSPTNEDHPAPALIHIGPIHVRNAIICSRDQYNSSSEFGRVYGCYESLNHSPTQIAVLLPFQDSMTRLQPE